MAEHAVGGWRGALLRDKIGMALPGKMRQGESELKEHG